MLMQESQNGARKSYAKSHFGKHFHIRMFERSRVLAVGPRRAKNDGFSFQTLRRTPQLWNKTRNDETPPPRAAAPTAVAPEPAPPPRMAPPPPPQSHSAPPA